MLKSHRMDVNFPQFTESTVVKGFSLHKLLGMFLGLSFFIFFSECFDYVLVFLYMRRFSVYSLILIIIVRC